MSEVKPIIVPQNSEGMPTNDSPTPPAMPCNRATNRPPTKTERETLRRFSMMASSWSSRSGDKNFT